MRRRKWVRKNSFALCGFYRPKGNNKLLISEVADVDAKDQKGKTTLDTAYGQTADLLRKHGAKTSEELDAAGKQTNSLHHLNA